MEYPNKWPDSENLGNLPDIWLNWGLRGKDYDKCIHCGEMTKEKHSFCDDVEQNEEGNSVCSSASSEFCHNACFERLQEKAR